MNALTGLIYACIFLLNWPARAEGEPQFPYIDFHVHPTHALTPNNLEIEFMRFATTKLNDKARVFSILISPTYHSQGGQTLKSFRALNKKFSGLIQETPRTAGLCGIDVLVSDGVEKARACLKMPGFVGLKLRMPSETTRGAFLSPELAKSDTYFSRIDGLAGEVNRRGGIILIRFEERDPAMNDSGSDFDPLIETHLLNGDLRETKALLSLAVKYRLCRFVIAHNGLSQAIRLNGLNYIGEFYRSHPRVPENIYVEVSRSLALLQLPQDSALMSRTSLAIMKRIAETWRIFGRGRVLFGTDMAQSEMSSDVATWFGLVTENPYLSSIEKRAILYQNGARLLDEIADMNIH